MMAYAEPLNDFLNYDTLHISLVPTQLSHLLPSTLLLPSSLSSSSSSNSFPSENQSCSGGGNNITHSEAVSDVWEQERRYCDLDCGDEFLNSSSSSTDLTLLTSSSTSMLSSPLSSSSPVSSYPSPSAKDFSFVHQFRDKNDPGFCSTSTDSGFSSKLTSSFKDDATNLQLPGQRHSSKNVKDQTATTTGRRRPTTICKATPSSTRAKNTLPPCRICGDAASGFHYGVNSCEACKRFFRRALKRKRLFKCKANKNCRIQGKKHNLCGFCRYARCLSLGMSKTAIKTGRYTQQKRAQDSQEVQRLESARQGRPQSPVDMTHSEAMEIIQQLTEAHEKMLTNFHVPREVMEEQAKRTLEDFQLKKEMFGFQGTLTPEQYDEVFSVTGLDVDERQKDMRFVAKAMDSFAYGYVRFGKGVPSFSRLSLKDQANLLKLARVEVWFLGSFRGLMKQYDVFCAPVGTVNHRMELGRFLGQDYVDHAFDLAHVFQEMDLTFEEVVVLKAVCLTFSDRCSQLDDKDLLETIHWRLVRCFLHLLRQNHPGHEAGLFHKVVSSLVAMRNLTQLSQKALSNIHFTDAIRNNATLSDLILI